jgi:hypothetical protein
MKYRKLRIAWSVVCGVLCLLLIALWERSLKTCDVLSRRYADGWMKTMLFSSHGTLVFEQSRDDAAGRPGWHYIAIDGCDPPSQTFAFKLAAGWKLIRIPDWLPLMFCIAAATGPWLPWRFSLRTLLIALTILAVLCGLAAATIGRAPN